MLMVFERWNLWEVIGFRGLCPHEQINPSWINGLMG
jgi:hypothetical protein